MAGFKYNGVDAIEASLSQLAALPGDARERIIMAGAELIRDRLKAYLNAHHRRTGQLADSITAKYYSSGAALVEPGKTVKGKKRRLAQTHAGSGATNRSKHHGATGSSSMADVGYYLEYGTPRMKAAHWMETSNEQSMPDFDRVMAAAWDEYLKSINL